MIKTLVTLLIFLFTANVFAQNDNAAQAKSFLDALAGKDFAKAYDYFGDEVKAKIPAEILPQIWAQITGEYGEFRRIKEFRKTSGENLFIAVLEFEKKTDNFAFAFNKQGKILGFTLAPASEAAKYETPNYANTNSFEEKEVTVGSGEWALPATLTMPKGKTNVPAIVLVHGSGANDRDETHINHANKVFKDLAWGLASRGIAVLRYDKRTLVYGQKLSAYKNFTVNEETVDDALLAAELLRQTPNVNAKNIFVLGHSLGGYLIPRIGMRDKNIAGFISLAGSTRHIEDSYLEQTIYFSTLDGAASKDEQAQIDALKQLVAKIKSLKESDRNSGEVFLGAPVSYYLDLQNYNPAESAESLKQPMLFLQGESDYQVTMTDFANWKNALQSRKNVTFKTYPNLTHAFMESAGGKPSPKDYEKTNHVSEIVINDIAAWILKTAKK